MSLNGTLSDIFNRIVRIGSSLTKQFLVDYDNHAVRFTPQKNLEKNPPMKRRHPEDGFFSLPQIASFSYQYLANCIRALAPPYPTCIVYTDTIHIAVQQIQFIPSVSEHALLITQNKPLLKIQNNKKNLVLKLKKGYAKITKFTVEKTATH
jgi:hypothetical protein